MATATRAKTTAPDPPAARVRESGSVIGLSFLGIAQGSPSTVTYDGHLGNKEILDPDPQPGESR